MKVSFFIAAAIIAGSFSFPAMGENNNPNGSDFDEIFTPGVDGSEMLLAAAPRKKAAAKKAAPKAENYPNLDIFTVVQQNEDKLDTYRPIFDKATAYKYVCEGLAEIGLDASFIQDYAIGCGTIGKDQKIAVAINLNNFDSTPMVIANIKDGKVEHCGMYWATRERDEFEIHAHCEGCGWRVDNIACKYYFSDKNELPYLLGVWNKTTSEAPKSKQQTLPFIVRLFN